MSRCGVNDHSLRLVYKYDRGVLIDNVQGNVLGLNMNIFRFRHLKGDGVAGLQPVAALDGAVIDQYLFCL